MAKKAIYPGSFDPVTNGHLDVVERASHIFDEVVVAVAHNTNKKALFSLEERVGMLEDVTSNIPNVSIDSFDGLVIDYARENNMNVLIRGLRMTSDFEYEFQIALTNRRLADDIETVFLMPREHNSFIASTLIKEVTQFKGDISSFVPPIVEERLKEKLL